MGPNQDRALKLVYTVVENDVTENDSIRKAVSAALARFPTSNRYCTSGTGHLFLQFNLQGVHKVLIQQFQKFFAKSILNIS